VANKHLNYNYCRQKQCNPHEASYKLLVQVVECIHSDNNPFI